nr:MAG TPA: hypothetical protein [Caudoviricetes sp.]
MKVKPELLKKSKLTTTKPNNNSDYSFLFTTTKPK